MCVAKKYLINVAPDHNIVCIHFTTDWCIPTLFTAWLKQCELLQLKALISFCAKLIFKSMHISYIKLFKWKTVATTAKYVVRNLIRAILPNCETVSVSHTAACGDTGGKKHKMNYKNLWFPRSRRITV